MAIAFNNLFTLLGKYAGGLNEWNTGRGATLTARVGTLRTNMAAIGVDLDLNLTNSQNSAVGAGEGWVGYLKQCCWDAVRQAVINDRPQTGQNQTAVLAELVRQMGVSAQSLAQSLATIGSVTAVGVPTGTPTFVVSDLDQWNPAARSDWTLPDTLLFVGVGSGVSVSVQGLNATSPDTYPLWPEGSGVNTSLNQLDASVSTLGSDPGFETWTGGPPTPTQWTTTVGTAGTTVSQATDTPITGVGTYSLQLQGDGTTSGTPLRVRQLVSVSPNEVYFLHAFLKRTANPANTGTLTVSLRDEAGNLISGTSNISILTSAIATSWTANTAALCTPSVLPSAVYLEIRYNPGNGDTVRLDQVALNPLPLLYVGGLRVAVVKGATATVPGDSWTLTTTRANPTLSFIRQLNRLMDLDQYTIRIPTSGAPTQADALVS